MILLANGNSYKRVFLNWLVLANYHGIENYLIISLDEKTQRFCEAVGVPAHFFENIFGPRVNLTREDLWYNRVKIILRTLKLGVGVHIMDADVFMLINPYPFLHHELYDFESLGGMYLRNKIIITIQ